MPPDLWAVVEGQHRFIEVKIPGDRLRETQVAGLAAIATWLSRRSHYSVWLYDLYRAGDPEPKADEALKAKFREFTELCGLTTACSRRRPDHEPPRLKR